MHLCNDLHMCVVLLPEHVCRLRLHEIGLRRVSNDRMNSNEMRKPFGDIQRYFPSATCIALRTINNHIWLELLGRVKLINFGRRKKKLARRIYLQSMNWNHFMFIQFSEGKKFIFTSSKKKTKGTKFDSGRSIDQFNRRVRKQYRLSHPVALWSVTALLVYQIARYN